MKGLEGKRVVVTGGTSGIGEATSRRFLDEGARVVALAVGEDEVATAQERIPGIAAALRVDVADAAQVADAFTQVDDILGGVDVLVANAGISIRKPFLEIETADWRRVLDVNLTGVFNCAQQAARRMYAGDGGVVLMTASTNGLTGHAYYADYNASKAGVINLVKVAATQMVGANIRVNAICPGLIETGMTEYIFERARAKGQGDRIGHLNPLKRGGQPIEIANVALFLASDESSYVNGQALAVDGGLSASHPFNHQSFGRTSA